MALTGPQQGQLAFARETTWGTAVTPDKFLPLLSEDLDLSFDPVMDDAVRSGRRMMIAEQHQNGNRQAGGSFQTHLYGIGMRTLLESLFGTETDPGSGTPTRAFVYTPGDVSDDPLTIETNAPGSGANHVKTLEGAMITGATFEYPAGGLAKVTWDVVGETLARGTTATSATFPVAVAHKAIGMTFTLTDYTAPILKSAKIAVALNLATDRYGAASDTRAQPIEAGIRKVDLDLVLEFSDDSPITQHEAHTEVDVALSSTDGTNTLGWALHGYVKPGPGPKLNTRTGLLEHNVGITVLADAAGGTDADAIRATYTTSEDVA